MLKKNKIQIIIASVINFIPTILGLIFWNKLPEVFPIHWGVDGNADGFGGKAFFVLVMPLVLYALFWLCLMISARDSGNKNQNNKVFGMIIWIIPFISLFVSAISYFGASGRSFELMALLPAVLGLLFAAMGNYMPKCKQNRTIGVRIKWTLENEENWNATHRFTGKVMFFGGLLMMLCCFLPEFWGAGIALAIVFVCVLATYIYSYAYYKKQKKAGTYGINTSLKPMKKSAIIVSVILIVLILAGVAVLMFTGDVEVVLGDETLVIDSTYESEITVNLNDIQTIQYVESFDGGTRNIGFASAKLALGDYTNESYRYTSYRYVGTDSCVVIFTKQCIIAFNQPTDEETKAIYEALKEKRL